MDGVDADGVEVGERTLEASRLGEHRDRGRPAGLVLACELRGVGDLGERTLLDLLDSENELFTASRRLAEIKNIQLFTQYRIKATMGELLKSQGVVAPLASVVQNDVKPKVQLPGMN